MRIAVTGATGFIGRYIVNLLVSRGHECRCWYRPGSDRGGFDANGPQIEWVEGELGRDETCHDLVADCDAVIHSAVWRPGSTFQGGEGDLVKYTQINLVGSIALIEAARSAGVHRFVYLSSCAVHDEILDDRPLDETHPLWPGSHYGACKAALEAFVHSYARGHHFSICALRPTGVYGVRRPIEQSKWFDLVQNIVRGEQVECRGGGKEVHAADVARAALLLTEATDQVNGQVYNCYDRYVSQYDVAHLAKKLAQSVSRVEATQTQPKHQIENAKIRQLGMQFGGPTLLEETVRHLVQLAVAKNS